MLKKLSPKLIIILLVAILIAGIIYFIFFNKKTPLESIVGDEIENEITGLEKTYTLTLSKDNPENNVYTDSQYKFSFEYPKDFTVTKFQEGEYGNTILVSRKDPSTGSGQESFQIFIAPFDEPGPLTKERVLIDLPDLVINNPENRILKNGAVALIFFSEESSIGKTREVWFINGGYLYQISTYKELDGLVAAIISTWRFQ